MRLAVVVAFAATLMSHGSAKGQQSQASGTLAVEGSIGAGIERRIAPLSPAGELLEMVGRVEGGAAFGEAKTGQQPPVTTFEHVPIALMEKRLDPPIGPQPTIPDRWFAGDKVRHFFTSAMLQSLGYGTLRAMDVEHGAALAGASVVTAGFGIGKEFSDRRRGYGFSVRDLVWDAAGAVAISVLLTRTER